MTTVLPVFQSAAYLGPAGTYTELALRTYAEVKDAVPCPTIGAVFDAVTKGAVEIGIVPLENMLKGPITETLDLLLELRGAVHIADSQTLAISHSLGVLKDYASELNDDWRKIEAVYSHQQALQQCSKFIGSRLGHCSATATSSTVAAMRAVQESGSKAAVIGASQSLIDNGFAILAENIANVQFNKTRFALIKAGESPREIIDQVDSASPLDYVTSIALNPKRDRQGILHDLLNVISETNRVNMLSIHSRPDAFGGFVFYIDIEGHAGSPIIRKCLSDLEDYCQTKTGGIAEITVFGSYRREAFRAPLFKRIGIIGAEGKMGRWFQGFLTNAGFEVLGVDKESSLTIENLCQACDVILLSIPMSEVAGVVSELAKHIQPGQLIVENCSIKNSAIPSLEQAMPSGVEILGIHTMFGGDVETLRGENVIVTKTTASSEMATAFEELLYKHGAKIAYADIDLHDTLASFSQSLTHVLMIALAEVSADSFESVEQLEDFYTRNSRQLIATIKRVLSQNNYLIEDLQMRNPKSRLTRRRFLEIIFRLITDLTNGSDEELLKSLDKGRKFFKISKN